MPTHDRLDLARWIRDCPLGTLRASGRRLYVDNLDGPRDIAVLEQLRREDGMAGRGRAVQTDLCIWSLGEPKDPTRTKIGGAPYRPTDAPWPTTPDGTPMGLLAQFNFTDSLDVLEPGVREALPGDLLLLFTAGPQMYSDWFAEEPDTWALEWHRVGTHAAVRPAEHVHDLTPTFATLHRTVDYPDSKKYDELDVVWGTKFGGVHPYQQGDPELPGRPLCMLASINPFGGPWPLLNVPTNPNGEQYLDRKLLMMGDLGSAYFNLDAEGRVHWSADCG